MPSTPRRKSVTSSPTASLFGIAAPLLALLAGACLEAPADSDSDGTTDGSSSGGTSTATPTTGDDTGTPALAEGRYFVRIDDDPVPPVVLEMDKAKVLEVFGEEATRKIKLLDVDSTPLLVNVLTSLQNACGTGWTDKALVNVTAAEEDVKLAPSTLFDCNATELGKSFGPNWLASSEFAMVRLLSLTPGLITAKGVKSTSLYDLALAFKGPQFRKILAGSLFCDGTPAQQAACAKSPPTDLLMRPVLPIAILAETLKQTLLATHPNINNAEGKLPITLYDALHDMQPLAEKLGPSGVHPGLLVADDAAFTTQSDALTPAFRMRAVAESNLRLVEGVDASNGSGSMFLNVGDVPLVFDFNDPEKLQMLGIADAPIVDMRMQLSELPIPVPSCTGDACKTNLPDQPTDSFVWSKDPWTLEHIIAKGAFNAFLERSFEYCYLAIDPCDPISIGTQGNPKGWSLFMIDTLAKGPQPQYLWELLLEVAQAAVHDPSGDGTGDILEGKANPIFALKGVPIGLTAEQMIAEIRPNLQAQAEFIAKTILGKFWKHNDHLDFYYRRGSDGGAPILFFVAPSDPRPDANDPEALATYGYAKPGFFADPALATRLSKTALDGVADTEHEKLQLPVGETTVYMQDDAGKNYSLRFFVPTGADPTEIIVHVRPV